MTRTILVPHEDNEASGKAIKYAIEIAKGMDMAIKLVRVVPEVVDFSTMSHWNAAERKRVKEALGLYRNEVQDKKPKTLGGTYPGLTPKASKHRPL